MIKNPTGRRPTVDYLQSVVEMNPGQPETNPKVEARTGFEPGVMQRVRNLKVFSFVKVPNCLTIYLIFVSLDFNFKRPNDVRESNKSDIRLSQGRASESKGLFLQ